MLRERSPIATASSECSSEESAWFLEFEKEYLGMPNHLRYPHLEEHIDEPYRPLVEQAWMDLVKKAFELRESVQCLKNKWERTPICAVERFLPRGGVTDSLIDNYSIPVPQEHKNSISHTATPAFKKVGNLSRLRNWQRDESGNREKFTSDHQDFMTALRIYYETLLETDKTGTKSILPLNSDLRKEVQHRNKMVRIINTAYICIQVAKGVHNEQSTGRLRKYEEVPYVMHSSRVTLASLMDTVPFMNPETDSTIDPILIAAVTPAHDAIEDAGVSLKRIVELLTSRTDVYDTSIKIRSNFPDQQEELTGEDLLEAKTNLVKNPKIAKRIEALLRILTDDNPRDESANKAPLSNAEIRKAIEQNLFGEEQTLFHLGLLSEKDLALGREEKQRAIALTKQVYGVNRSMREQEMCSTGCPFPAGHDNGKLTRFLIRADAISACASEDEAEQRTLLQHALVIKFNDRAHNLLTKPSDTQEQVQSKREDLRDTFSRLITYTIYEYDNTNYPLHNSLPRIVRTTLKVYKELAQSHPEMIEDIDREYIDKLEALAENPEITIVRFKTSAQTDQVVEKFAEAKKKQGNEKALRGTVYEFTHAQAA